MLRAYFDDSGTHDASEVVVVGGIMGTELELLSLDATWREHLDNPLGGLRQPIREYHATDCVNSVGDFFGWKRHETDYFRHQLGEAIIRAHVSGYGFACVREESDAESKVICAWCLVIFRGVRDNQLFPPRLAVGKCKYVRPRNIVCV